MTAAKKAVGTFGVSHQNLNMGWSSLDEAFPTVDPKFKPWGSRVLVQIRQTKKKTMGNVILPDSVKEAEKWNTQTAKIIAVGPMAFRDRRTAEPWPEWSLPISDEDREKKRPRDYPMIDPVGTFVRVGKFGGDKWEREIPGSDERVLFALFEDLQLFGEDEEPLSTKVFV